MSSPVTWGYGKTAKIGLIPSWGFGRFIVLPGIPDLIEFTLMVVRRKVFGLER